MPSTRRSATSTNTRTGTRSSGSTTRSRGAGGGRALRAGLPGQPLAQMGDDDRRPVHRRQHRLALLQDRHGDDLHGRRHGRLRRRLLGAEQPLGPELGADRVRDRRGRRDQGVLTRRRAADRDPALARVHGARPAPEGASGDRGLPAGAALDRRDRLVQLVPLRRRDQLRLRRIAADEERPAQLLRPPLQPRQRPRLLQPAGRPRRPRGAEDVAAGPLARPSPCSPSSSP